MKTPQVGEYYYHHKHDREKGINDHAYVIEGIALDTHTDKNVVVYRPPYGKVWMEEKGVQLLTRPLDVFMANKIVDGKEVPRFTRITDRALLSLFA